MTRIRMFVLAVLLGAGLPLAALAQVAKDVDGTVTRVDVPAEKMTIRHGPIKEFDMTEGMTMVFRAKDAAMLKAVKAGDNVRFDVERVQGQFTVTKIQKTK